MDGDGPVLIDDRRNSLGYILRREALFGAPPKKSIVYKLTSMLKKFRFNIRSNNGG